MIWSCVCLSVEIATCEKFLIIFFDIETSLALSHTLIPDPLGFSIVNRLRTEFEDSILTADK
jgi:hypothetical protein